MWADRSAKRRRSTEAFPAQSSVGDAWVSALCEPLRAQQSWTLQQQMTLAAIAAPTGNESRRALAMQQALQAVGGDASIDATGNVSCVVEATAPGRTDVAPLVCLAHLDSVYTAPPSLIDCVEMQRSGPLVRGTGIGDNGRGLAGLLTLARLLHMPDVRARLTRPVHLVATVGEEGDGDLRGARAWFDAAAAQGIDPVAAVAIDGPGDENIVHHAAGSHRIRVSLHGAGGHSWVHATAENPIHVLGEFITRAARLSNAKRRDAVVHITRTGGGESLTSIPQQSWAEVDLRGTSALRIERVRRELYGLVHEVTPASLRANITVIGDRPAGSLDGSHPLVELAQRATEQVGAIARSAVASTDANIPLSRGIPAIAIGAGGRGGGAHTRDEWYDDTHGARGMERLLRLVLSLAAA